MSRKLEGKVAVVTGSSKGIGAQIARRFAEEGAKVVVNYARSRDAADGVVAAIQADGGKAVAIQADVRDRAQVAELFAASEKAFGPVDILVNNAGVYQFAPLESIDEGHFRNQFDLNVLGLIYATQEAVRQFGARGGNIVNLSSVVGLTPAAGGVVYSATKAAVESITRGLALELSGKARVNAIAPGMVETEGLHDMGPDQAFKDFVLMRSAVKRLGAPDDIAKAAVYLASEDSAWVSGETLVVSGGMRL
ncbi:MAG: glucose 1-dehydrogenase [Bryobacteraceae bacterium]